MNNWRDKLFVTLQYLVPQHGLSRLVGMLARSEVPWIKTTFINLFMKRFGIDLSEAQIEDADRFPTFNAFFTRALKADARPLEASGDNEIACRQTVLSASSAPFAPTRYSRPRGTITPSTTCSVATVRWPVNSPMASSPPSTSLPAIITVCTCLLPAPCAKPVTCLATCSR